MDWANDCSGAEQVNVDVAGVALTVTTGASHWVVFGAVCTGALMLYEGFWTAGATRHLPITAGIGVCAAGVETYDQCSGIISHRKCWLCLGCMFQRWVIVQYRSRQNRRNCFCRCCVNGQCFGVISNRNHWLYLFCMIKRCIAVQYCSRQSRRNCFCRCCVNSQRFGVINSCCHNRALLRGNRSDRLIYWCCDWLNDNCCWNLCYDKALYEPFVVQLAWRVLHEYVVCDLLVLQQERQLQESFVVPLVLVVQLAWHVLHEYVVHDLLVLPQECLLYGFSITNGCVANGRFSRGTQMAESLLPAHQKVGGRNGFDFTMVRDWCYIRWHVVATLAKGNWIWTAYPLF